MSYTLVVADVYTQWITKTANELEVRHTEKWKKIGQEMAKEDDSGGIIKHWGAFLSLAVYSERFRRPPDDRGNHDDARGGRALLPRPVCECRWSFTAGGRGAFATVDINKWNYITFYPADGFRIKSNDGSFAITVLDGDFDVTTTRRGDSESLRSQSIYMDEEEGDATKYSLSIIGDPRRCEDPAFMGHLINDCNNRFTTNEKSVNAVYDEIQNCFIATKFIAAGQEILTLHGDVYWRRMLCR